MKKPSRLKVTKIPTVDTSVIPFKRSVNEIYKLEYPDGSLMAVGVPKAKEAVNIYGVSHSITCENTQMYYFQ